ncbi:MAG: PilW family protein [Pseudomonadota bacterium]|nr:PilW family protein [Pseudomonadota bacterium]
MTTPVLTIPHNQRGYTLIELIVALALGVLISAAAVQLSFTSQRTFALQQGAAETQDSGLFGLGYIARNVRMANYGSGRPIINDETPNGGIVLTTLNAPVSTDLVTKTGGESNVTFTGSKGSAHLVIQYRAPQDMFDCEGRRVLGPRVLPATATDAERPVQGDLVVERYFLRTDTVTTSNEPSALALACSAGQYNNLIEEKKDLDWGAAQGQVIMGRVDHFDVRLGVIPNPDMPDQQAYYTIDEYKASAASPKPRIVSVQLAVLTRAQSRAAGEAVDADQKYQMFGQDVTLKAAAKGSGFVRKVYTTTVALRNGRGE